MLSLAEIAAAVNGELRNASGLESIHGICYDSRKAKNGDIFVAIKGHNDDGSEFVADALKRGASAVIQERVAPTLDGVPTVLVANARAALAGAAWPLQGNPQKTLKLVGVTGTNGKTTVAAALAQLLTLRGRPTGVCGTLGMYFGNLKFDSDRTTAEAPELATAFSSMVSNGATHVALEATSIGLVMHRLDELLFDVGVFTNLSRDHLDFHGTWDNYRRAKMMLFESDRLTGTAVINIDDPESAHFIRTARRQVLTFGLTESADFRASEIELGPAGTTFRLHWTEGDFNAQTMLIGQFNVMNTLAIIASAYSLGLSIFEILDALPHVKPVRGRAEVIASSAPFTVLVDYAHTPDALEKILSTVRGLTKTKLSCVIGAGGDRDKGKRPLMAQAAEKWSDVVYLTSDNPRSEEPQAIVNDMIDGIVNKNSFFADVDRRATIVRALEQARAGDVIIVAGKGHETYQEIRGVKYPFDDAAIVREWLRANGWLK